MKKTILLSALAILAFLAIPSNAQADLRVGFQIGLPVYGGYCAPPVYYAPPPVVYYAPRPVFYAPPRVVYSRSTVVYRNSPRVIYRDGYRGGGRYANPTSRVVYRAR